MTPVRVLAAWTLVVGLLVGALAGIVLNAPGGTPDLGDAVVVVRAPEVPLPTDPPTPTAPDPAPTAPDAAPVVPDPAPVAPRPVAPAPVAPGADTDDDIDDRGDDRGDDDDDGDDDGDD